MSPSNTLPILYQWRKADSDVRYEHADGLVGVYREQEENSSRTLTLDLRKVGHGFERWTDDSMSTRRAFPSVVKAAGPKGPSTDWQIPKYGTSRYLSDHARSRRPHAIYILCMVSVVEVN